MNNIPIEIQKIIKILKTTKLQYLRGSLYTDTGIGKLYCLEGILCIRAGIKRDDIEDENLANIDYSILEDLHNFVGFNLFSDYRENGYIVKCPLRECITNITGKWKLSRGKKKCGEELVHADHVFWHINDCHNISETHKENAELITEFSKYYNIRTGANITGANNIQ